jgi:DNA-binding IclR family transcriptional regulator
VTHSDYLAAEVEPPSRTRLTQISAPVFLPSGEVVASLMALGPGHEVTAAYVAALGEAVASAAARATQELAATGAR